MVLCNKNKISVKGLWTCMPEIKPGTLWVDDHDNTYILAYLPNVTFPFAAISLKDGQRLGAPVFTAAEAVQGLRLLYPDSSVTITHRD